MSDIHYDDRVGFCSYISQKPSGIHKQVTRYPFHKLDFTSESRIKSTIGIHFLRFLTHNPIINFRHPLEHSGNKNIMIFQTNSVSESVLLELLLPEPLELKYRSFPHLSQ